MQMKSCKMLRKLKTSVKVTLLISLALYVQYELMQFAMKLNQQKSSIRRQPSKVTTLVFLKTHKTASSTITCILSRFVDNNDLDIVLPMAEVSRFSWPKPFTPKSVDIRRLRKEKGHVLCHHAVFSSKNEFQKVLYPEPKFITILRNPIDRFESQFFYDNFDQYFNSTKQDNLLMSFLSTKLVTGWNISVKPEHEQIVPLFTNGMLLDLTGAVLDENSTKEHIQSLVMQVERNFDFVMLMEYFDEGLIYVRKLFGWKLLDLVYVKRKVRKKRHEEFLTEEVKSKITSINQADVILYNHFLSIFEKRLTEYGDELNRHLEIFRSLNEEISKQCKRKESFISKDELEDKLKELKLSEIEEKIIGDLETIPPCFCSQLHRKEVSYVRYFKDKFRPYHFARGRRKDWPLGPC